jgi:DNA-binding transcriptional LysR family regulator
MYMPPTLGGRPGRINEESCNDREATIHEGLSMLERHEVEAFLALAEELHFGRAADRLRVSTTRVSQIIRKLERRVGVPLFDRTSRRVQLTAVGRQLYEDVRPAWEHITASLQRATDAGRGLTGTLRAGFVGAAGGQLMFRVAELFRDRHRECDVQIREAQIGEAVPWILDGEVDIALVGYPADAPGLTAGGALISEARMLAVPAEHPLAAQESVSAEDLARIPLIRLPATIPEALRAMWTPDTTPGGRRIEAGPVATTFQEMLALIGSGRGAFPVGAHVRRYYVRPDVVYVFFSDAPPIEWGLVWRTDNATARVLAFNDASRNVVRPT